MASVTTVTKDRDLRPTMEQGNPNTIMQVLEHSLEDS